jgi:hypothetical protein
MIFVVIADAGMGCAGQWRSLLANSRLIADGEALARMSGGLEFVH